MGGYAMTKWGLFTDEMGGMYTDEMGGVYTVARVTAVSQSACTLAQGEVRKEIYYK
jgi:hypothetical protein